MNKRCVIVVEGKTDKDFLSSFISDADFILTNGSALSQDTIERVRTISQKTKVIVLTDPDAPGKKIRDELNRNIDGLYNAFVPKEKCIKNGKVGIAESSKEDVLNALSHLVPPCPQHSSDQNELNMQDLYELELIGSERASFRREIVCRKLHIGQSNGKTFLKLCRSLGLNKNDLVQYL